MQNVMIEIRKKLNGQFFLAFCLVCFGSLESKAQDSTKPLIFISNHRQMLTGSAALEIDRSHSQAYNGARSAGLNVLEDFGEPERFPQTAFQYVSNTMALAVEPSYLGFDSPEDALKVRRFNLAQLKARFRFVGSIISDMIPSVPKPDIVPIGFDPPPRVFGPDDISNSRKIAVPNHFHTEDHFWATRNGEADESRTPAFVSWQSKERSKAVLFMDHYIDREKLGQYSKIRPNETGTVKFYFRRTETFVGSVYPLWIEFAGLSATQDTGFHHVFVDQDGVPRAILKFLYGATSFFGTKSGPPIAEVFPIYPEEAISQVQELEMNGSYSKVAVHFEKSHYRGVIRARVQQVSLSPRLPIYEHSYEFDRPYLGSLSVVHPEALKKPNWLLTPVQELFQNPNGPFKINTASNAVIRGAKIEPLPSEFETKPKSTTGNAVTFKKCYSLQNEY